MSIVIKRKLLIAVKFRGILESIKSKYHSPSFHTYNRRIDRCRHSLWHHSALSSLCPPSRPSSPTKLNRTSKDSPSFIDNSSPSSASSLQLPLCLPSRYSFLTQFCFGTKKQRKFRHLKCAPNKFDFLDPPPSLPGKKPEWLGVVVVVVMLLRFAVRAVSVMARISHVGDDRWQWWRGRESARIREKMSS